MSDIDNEEDQKREYLPLVNHMSEGKNSSRGNNDRVNNKSVLSSVSKEEKVPAFQDVNMQNQNEQTFYQKNKKIIKIAGIILIIVAVILAIVLPLTLGGGGDNPTPPKPPPVPPEPNPNQPDPYLYQEFNPFYVDPNNPPVVNTFQASINLNFNNTAFTTNLHASKGRAMGPKQLRKAVRTFMGIDTDSLPEDGSDTNTTSFGDNTPLNGTNYRPVNPRYVVNTTNNLWANRINVNITMNKGIQARVLITNPDSDANETLRRQVNTDFFERPPLEIESRLQQVGFKYNTTASFAFNFTDIYQEETLISTMYRKLMVSDFYSEIGLVVPTQRCFGLGQRNGKFQVDQGTYTFNARSRDDSLPQDDGLGGKSGNHIHPFLLCQSANKMKDFFGIFFVSNGPQVFEIVKFTNSTKMVVNYITIGGVIEFYVLMLGPAQDIVSRYHSIVGMPMMPPYYSLGVFHGSNSYKTWSQFKSVYDNYAGAFDGNKQALEGVFVENYEQQSHWTFTVDQTNFPNLGAEVDKIHANNQRAIFGASLALSPNPNYAWYNTASSAKCLVKSLAAVAIGPLTGVLDQTNVQYLDSFSQCYETFMTATLPTFVSSTAHGLDGLWVKDSHTPNHINGQISVPGNEEKKSQKGRNLQSRDDPPQPSTALNEEQVGFFSPYQINNITTPTDLSTYYLPFIPAFKYSGALDNMTISLNSTLGDSLGGGRYSSLLVRNGMAGFALKRTYNVIQKNILKNNSRPLLFSDASWAGSGAHSVALITDLYRSWSDMKNVISQVLSLSMYGMTATMVDTCGSLGPIDEDLCTRWTQLATFMPMVRNYYNSTYREQQTGDRKKTQGTEPWMAKSDSAKLAYAALGDRLKLSRYLYTQMYLSHANGGSLVKPLFFDYPTDDQCFTQFAQESTFMLGDSVKVSPLLENKQDGDTYQAYFPAGAWVDIYNTSNVIQSTDGIVANLPVYSTQTNIHQKSGTIMPFLYNNKNLRTTRDVELNLKTTIRVVRDPVTKYAEGHLMLDDGISPNIFSPSYFDIYQYHTYDKNFTHYNIRMSSDKTINFQLQNGDIDYQLPPNMTYQFLDSIEILNAEDLADSDFACALNRTWDPINFTVYYTNSTKTLTLKPKSAGVTFDQLMAVKFGNSTKDVSWCQGFTYTANLKEDNRTYWRFDLVSTQAPGLLEDLVAEFTLLDDDGSINVEITTISDYNVDGDNIFRPPQPEFYTLDKFKAKETKRDIAEFVQQTNKTQFAFKIMNKTGGVVYESDPYRLMIDKYFVISSGNIVTNPVNGRPLLGIGERSGRALLKNQKDFVHTIWPYDQPNPIDDGKPPGKNDYGYQPVYYYQAATSDWITVFDVGTYASDYFINTNIDGQNTTKVTKVAVGGIIHKIFLQARKIEDAIKKYQMLTGTQTVAPMWAFGWNQCKFGYFNEDIWWGVYQNYTKFNIPLDTMWGDIDYMDDYKVFTISPQSYANLSQRVDQIRSEGRYFVPIIDNAIAVRPNQQYQPYETGLQNKVFIMKSDLSGPATGGVWPGHAYYPDFFKNETKTWWSENLAEFNKKIQFDGIWLDMNEPSSTCTGYCYSAERPVDAVKYKLPYLPGSRDLEMQALGLDTVHTGLPFNNTYRTEMDVRSLYAIKESQATQAYLHTKNKRSFILSRSNAPGLQKYAFHWLADNWSKEEWMSTSVDSLYEYNLFGIPMMGSDICGFNIEATPELCTRWHQLGSFYPFSRNHKNSVWKQTEPFQYNFTVPELGDGRTYTDLIRTALLQRYSVLRFIYSSFHEIGQYGGAFFKPLFYEFQEDPATFEDDSTEVNIMLGNALKLSIQTRDLEIVSTEYLFPSSRWCQVFPSFDKTKCWDTTSQGSDSTTQRLDSGIADYQLHLRGGYIIPYQNATKLSVSKSQDLMKNPTELIVLANTQNNDIVFPTGTYNAAAAGYAYFDDGFSMTDIVRADFNVVINKDGTVTINFVTLNAPVDKDSMGQAPIISQITFLWASSTNFDQFNHAVLNQKTGGQVTLNPPVPVGGNQDLLQVPLATAEPSQKWAVWDISSIVLSKV